MTRSSLAFFVVMLSAVAALAQSPRAVDAMRARRTLIDASDHLMVVRNANCLTIVKGSMRFSGRLLEFDAVDSYSPKLAKRHYVVDFAALSPSVDMVWKNAYGEIRDHDRKHRMLRDENGAAVDGLAYFTQRIGALAFARCEDECRTAGTKVIQAIATLLNYAAAPGANAAAFAEKAAAWRALATKPPQPDTVRVKRLMAEDALKNNKSDEALGYYEDGLEIDPMWPQGWFNAGLVAGGLGYFEDAAQHMQRYLDLMPDAKDAQAARDQIAIWLEKAKDRK